MFLSRFCAPLAKFLLIAAVVGLMTIVACASRVARGVAETASA